MSDQQASQDNLNQTMIDILKTRDAKRGTALAQNLIESMGISKDDALSQATSWAKQAAQNDPRVKQLIQVLLPSFRF